jgi:uncharacterized membrane protein
MGMNKKWVLVSLIILAVAAARLPFLAGDVLGSDAAYHARAATAVLHGDLLYRDVPYTYPPLYAYTEALSIAAFGNTTIGWKMIAQLYDLGVVILVYLLASRIHGEKAGLMAALLYGFSPLPFLATSSFACFDSTAAFWMMASILLLLRGNKVPSAIALGVGTAYKYFPILLLWPALTYVKKTREKLLYFAAAAITMAIVQVPFLVLAFSDWLNNVILYHLNRPPMGASLYNLFSLPSQLSDTAQNPFVILSPIAVILVFIIIAFDKDTSEVGLIKKMALVMVTAVFFNKVVLFYALWFIPILCIFMLAQKKRNTVLTLIPYFVLQATILLTWYFYDSLMAESSAIVMAFIYGFSTALFLGWLLKDRIRSMGWSFRKKLDSFSGKS